MAEKRGVGSAPVRGRRVLVRVDFNVPQDPNGQVVDDRRLVEALPTLNHLRAAGARTILLTHLGRPNGQREPRLTLRPVVHRLSAILGQPVPLADDLVGVHALEQIARLENGQFLMLENLRFHPGEEANDPGFAAQLARLGELFVQDAFGVLHRAHASTVGVPKHLPSYAGFLVQREVRELSRLLETPARPYAVLVGGAKVEDKLPLLTSFLGRADALLIGGALAFPFLKARGASLGSPPSPPGLAGAVQEFLHKAETAGTEVLLPSDLVVERPGLAGAETHPATDLPADANAQDIGAETRTRFADRLGAARTVFWNGPLGRAEDSRFRDGTRAVLSSLVGAPGYRGAAGGASARIAQDLGGVGAFQFISTGGGAALEFVQGLSLPGLAVLPDA